MQAGSKRPREADEGKATAGDEEDLEAVLQKQQFEQLTEAADTLLRAGRFDIYSERKEQLREEADKAAAATAPATSGAAADADAAAAAAAEAGIDPQTHAGAVAGGFVLDAAHRVYYNASSGLYFDPRTSLYWPASGEGGYFYWDTASGQFVPAPQGETGGAQ